METIATKFVLWNVPNLETLQECKAYRIRVKLNNGEKLNRDEKNWITSSVNGNTFFKDSIPVVGWRFNFSDVLRTFLVKDRLGMWLVYKAIDKTALRKCVYGRIYKIVEVK